MKNTIIIAALVLLFTATAVQANLIQNPSFENVGANWYAYNVDWWSGWTAKDGTVSIDLSSTSAGYIQQEFPTAVGQSYRVSFWLAGNPTGDPTIKTMHVSAGSVSGREYTFDVDGHGYSDMGWTEESFLFQATGTTTTLKFESLDDTAHGPAIDLVSVDNVSVPLPPALLLFAPGLLGLAALRRRLNLS